MKPLVTVRCPLCGEALPVDIAEEVPDEPPWEWPTAAKLTLRLSDDAKAHLRGHFPPDGDDGEPAPDPAPWSKDATRQASPADPNERPGGMNGNTHKRYKRPAQQNLGGPAARLARRLNGAPEERQTRRQKREAKKARQRA